MIYARTYHDLMPLSSYFLFNNFDTILFSSIISSVKLKDLFIVAAMPVMLTIYLLNKKALTPLHRPIKTRLTAFLILAFTQIAFLAIECKKYNADEKGRTASTYWSRFSNPVAVGLNYVKVNGIIPYWVWRLSYNISDTDKLTAEDYKKIKKYFTTQRKSDYRGPNCKGKNLIVIIVESLNSWAVNYTIDGREVCPTLNSICRDDSSFVSMTCVPQVCDGRSSDAHFIYNVGLLPIRSGSVAVKYCNPNFQYPSLARALNGYTSITIHCDSPSFWNNDNAFKAYGFQKNINRYGIIDHLNKGEKEIDIKDVEMFKTAILELTKQKQPFYAQLITIAMHQPYNNCAVPKTWISKNKELPSETKNYLEAVHYFDNALTLFLQSLQKEDLYKNSVIAIISDHNEYDRNKIHNPNDTKSSVDDELCTFAVLNSGIGRKINTAVGQIDIYPTLLDIMGSDYQWRGIGQSLLDSNTIDCAILKDGTSYGKNTSVEKRLRDAWNISDIIIRKGYFKQRNKAGLSQTTH